MKFGIKIKQNYFFFFSALSLYMMRAFLNASLYDYILPNNWTRIVNGIVLALLVVKWLTSEKFTVKKLFIWVFVFSLLLVIAVRGNYLNIFIVFALIFSAQDINFDDILKFIMICTCIFLAFVVGSCAAGVLEDYTYSHSVVSIANFAHSWGFKYYSTLGYAAMTLTSGYLYFNRDCGYLRLFLLALINILFFFVHTTTLSILVSLLMIVAYIVIVKWKWLRFERKIWDYLGILAPVGFCFFTVLMVYCYARGFLDITASFFRTIIGRLNYSIQALNEYGLHLFGTKVQVYGNTALYYGEAESGFYIDSGYMYMLIAYGIVFTIVALLLYMTLSHYIYLCHDPFLYAWYIIILGICCINNLVFSLNFNPLLFLVARALFDVYVPKSKNSCTMLYGAEDKDRVVNIESTH